MCGAAVARTVSRWGETECKKREWNRASEHEMLGGGHYEKFRAERAPHVGALISMGV